MGAGGLILCFDLPSPHFFWQNLEKAEILTWKLKTIIKLRDEMVFLNKNVFLFQPTYKDCPPHDMKNQLTFFFLWNIYLIKC